MVSNRYEKEELIEYVLRAENESSGHLSEGKYREIRNGSWPSSNTLQYRFGSWNKAKRAAGLDTKERYDSGDTLIGRKYYNYLKDMVSCVNCGEDYNRALTFHHPDGVENSLGKNLGRSAPEKIIDEVSDCVVACSNCHRKHHGEDHPLDLDNFDKVNPPSIQDAKSELL